MDADLSVKLPSQKTILIIEDDRAISHILKSVLEVEGYQIALAGNGKDGIDILRESPQIDAVLLDMMMPVMTGWDFLDHMREYLTNKHIPVIIVSAYPEIAKSVHPDAFVPKPVQLKLLLDTVEKVVA
jgi:two-component system, response regulator, stage 0 sporulation protein F